MQTRLVQLCPSWTREMYATAVLFIIYPKRFIWHLQSSKRLPNKCISSKNNCNKSTKKLYVIQKNKRPKFDNTTYLLPSQKRSTDICWTHSIQYIKKQAPSWPWSWKMFLWDISLLVFRVSGVAPLLRVRVVGCHLFVTNFHWCTFQSSVKPAWLGFSNCWRRILKLTEMFYPVRSGHRITWPQKITVTEWLVNSWFWVVYYPFPQVRTPSMKEGFLW